MSKYLLHDLLANLPVGDEGVRQLRFEFAFPPTFFVLDRQHRFGTNTTSPPVVSFEDLRIDLVFLDTARAASSPVPKPILLSWPRYQVKRFPQPYDGTAPDGSEQSFTVRLAHDFAHTIFDRVMWWFQFGAAGGDAPYAYPCQYIGDRMGEFSSVVVREGGVEVAEYDRTDLARHMSTAHMVQKGHPMWPGLGSIAFATQQPFFLSMGTHWSRPIIHKGSGISSKILSGRNSATKNVELDIKITPVLSNMWTILDLCICMVTDVVADLETCSGSVRVQSAS